MSHTSGFESLVPGYPWMCPHFLPHVDTYESHKVCTPVEWVTVSHATDYWSEDGGWHSLCWTSIIYLIFPGADSLEGLSARHSIAWCSEEIVVWITDFITIIHTYAVKNAQTGMFRTMFPENIKVIMNSQSSMPCTLTYVPLHWAKITPNIQWKYITLYRFFSVCSSASL